MVDLYSCNMLHHVYCFFIAQFIKAVNQFQAANFVTK